MDDKGKKPIIGIDLGIDPEYLEEVVRQTVCAGIAESLGGKDAVASEIIHEVLKARVDDHGNVISEGNYRYDNGTPVIEYYVRKVVRAEAASYVSEMLEQYRPQIRDALAKELGKRQFANNLANQFVSALVDQATKDWRCKVDVSFVKPEREW